MCDRSIALLFLSGDLRVQRVGLRPREWQRDGRPGGGSRCKGGSRVRGGLRTGIFGTVTS